MLLNKFIHRLCNFNQITKINARRCTTQTKSSSNEVITEEKMGPIATIAINMPETKNQFDKNAFEVLHQALVRIENDETVSAGLIYGIGGNFCAGCVEGFVPDIRKLIFPNQKPLVASITGYATGFGFELALMCDLRVMEMTAQIGLNAYPQKMSEYFYERLVNVAGLSTALDLALTGRNLQYREAQQAKIIDRVVDCGTGIGQGIQLAKSVGKYPIENLRAAKSSIYSVISTKNKPIIHSTDK